MNHDLVDHIAATIRRVDGNHTMGAGALAEAIVADLPAPDNDIAIHKAVDALVDEGWEETHEGPLGIGTLSRDDLADIARAVLRSQVES